MLICVKSKHGSSSGMMGLILEAHHPDERCDGAPFIGLSGLDSSPKGV